jgi:hypothetical protein
MTTTQSTGTAHQTSAKAEQRGRPYTIVGAICAAVALFLLPIVFGPVGAVFGFVGYGRGDRKGLWAGIAAIVATFLGFLLAAMVIHARHH